MTEHEFAKLKCKRWQEACRAVGCSLTAAWEFGAYPHFRKKRGYGVTFFDGEDVLFRYAWKILEATRSRADGVIRHEIGHAMDDLIPAAKLDNWAAMRGYALPKTVERRADAIAEAIWRAPIYYDRELLVQTTRRNGYRIRPAHLGL